MEKVEKMVLDDSSIMEEQAMQRVEPKVIKKTRRKEKRQYYQNGKELFNHF